MKRALLTLGFLCACIHAQAIPYFEKFYPSIIQRIEKSGTFRGDRHGQFGGDDLVILKDKSVWKVHPESKHIFRSWAYEDPVHISFRTDWYWFKREHHFLMHNDRIGETIKVMLIRHKQQPALKVVSTEIYHKSKTPKYLSETKYVLDQHGNRVPKTKEIFAGWKKSDPRKVLNLSDGSVWVIKEESKFSDFHSGMHVYVGAQGDPNSYYDFVLITGNERDASYVFARPNKGEIQSMGYIEDE